MTLLVGVLTIGLILSLLALGVFISFRIFAFPDITADGSITVGGATAASLIVSGTDPMWATILGALAGAAAGATTGVLHTRFKIHGLLAGILVMTALYSVNLHIMGKSNVPLLAQETLATRTEATALRLAGGVETVNLWGGELRVRDVALLAASLIVSLAVGLLLYVFLQTDLGTAMRATGDNPQMIRALGRECRQHDRPGARFIERAHCPIGSPAGPVSGVCRRADGDRHDRSWPGQRHHR